MIVNDPGFFSKLYLGAIIKFIIEPDIIAISSIVVHYGIIDNRASYRSRNGNIGFARNVDGS